MQMIKQVSCAYCGKIGLNEEEIYKHIKDQHHDKEKLSIDEL